MTVFERRRRLKLHEPAAVACSAAEDQFFRNTPLAHNEMQGEMTIHDHDYAATTIAIAEMTAEALQEEAQGTGTKASRRLWLEAEAMAAAARLGPGEHDRAWLGEILREALLFGSANAIKDPAQEPQAGF